MVQNSTPRERQGEVPQTSLRSWDTHVEISACQRTDILAAKKKSDLSALFKHLFPTYLEMCMLFYSE